jgi:hypothetical protein
VCEVLKEDNGDMHNYDMNDLMDLWRDFYLLLLRIQRLLLKLESILRLWEKLLCFLLLDLAISEFPNRLRPPCTTMPWTIWPALVVLWGVCWMFYEGSIGNGEDQGDFSRIGNTIDPFEDFDYIDPSLGNCPPFSLFKGR